MDRHEGWKSEIGQIDKYSVDTTISSKRLRLKWNSITNITLTYPMMIIYNAIIASPSKNKEEKNGMIKLPRIYSEENQNRWKSNY